jgi:hypothetical protein
MASTRKGGKGGKGGKAGKTGKVDWYYTRKG